MITLPSSKGRKRFKWNYWNYSDSEKKHFKTDRQTKIMFRFSFYLIYWYINWVLSQYLLKLLIDYLLLPKDVYDLRNCKYFVRNILRTKWSKYTVFPILKIQWRAKISLGKLLKSQHRLLIFSSFMGEKGFFLLQGPEKPVLDNDPLGRFILM